MKSVIFSREFKITNNSIYCNKLYPQKGYRFCKPEVSISYNSSSSDDWKERRVFPSFERSDIRKYHVKALSALKEYSIENPFSMDEQTIEKATIGLLPNYIVAFFEKEENPVIFIFSETDSSVSHGDKYLYNWEFYTFLEKEML